MKLFITSAYRMHSCLDRVRELYSLDNHHIHEITTNPEEADAIVFIENTQFQDIMYSQLAAHPLLRRFPEKSYMYNEMDQSWPVLPGLYCSLSANLSSHSDHVAFPYLNVSNTGVQSIHKLKGVPELLYSFVGSASHPLRKKMFSVRSPYGKIVDTSKFCTWNPAQTSKYAYQKLYTDMMAASKFVLCPRGIGPASLRLYETMEAGRVPVIISDTWAEPVHIDWSFAVRVPEREIKSIPKRLLQLESEWQDRSHAARSAWETHYSPSNMFHTMASSIESISRTATLPEQSMRIAAHKWGVVLKQEARNLLKPPTGELPDHPIIHSLLGRFFSRKA